MTDDLPLFAVTHSRLHGEPTSYEAAKSVAEISAEQCRQLWMVIATFGPMTADEIDAMLEGHEGWKRTTAGRRVPDLVRDGLLEFTGEKRKTRSGRWANVYRVKVNTQEAA